MEILALIIIIWGINLLLKSFKPKKNALQIQERIEKKLQELFGLDLNNNFQESATRQQYRETPRQRKPNIDISYVDNMDGHDFEHYVAKLLRNQGYRTEVTKGSGDLGIDVIAQKEDIKYAIQVKRYSSLVSRSAVSDAVAGKAHYRCNAAMVVTNSFFSKGAQKLARSNKCRLVDRDELKIWIEKFG